MNQSNSPSTAAKRPTLALGDRPHIALYMLLKLEGWSPSGGAAKHAIDAGLVRVDGQVETRRRCKITPGQVVKMHGYEVMVTE
jgi:ribosome-associated protein